MDHDSMCEKNIMNIRFTFLVQNTYKTNVRICFKEFHFLEIKKIIKEIQWHAKKIKIHK